MALESSWGNSTRSITQNNISGFAVYKDSSKGTTFKSKRDCIMATAKILDRDYLNKDGIWFNGTSIYDVNKKYSSDENWSTKIIEIATDLKNK